MYTACCRNLLAKLLIPFAVLFVSFQPAFALKQDDNLVKKVREKITTYYPDQIKVTADTDGRVKLTGEVSVLYDKLNIFDITTHVSGVKFIENNIEVNTDRLPDDMILANITHTFQLMKSVSEPELVSFKIDNGLVFITGKVRFARESTMIETMVSWQQGVTGIANELVVEPILKAVDDSNLTIIINDLLKNEFSLEKDVTFTVKEGKVVLNGYTNRLWAKINLEKEIRRIVGVTDLENNLHVKDIPNKKSST